MSKIGELLFADKVSAEGMFRTLAMKMNIRLDAEVDDPNQLADSKSPAFRVSGDMGNGFVEVGAAWMKTIRNGQKSGDKYLNISIDDPSMAHAMSLTAFLSGKPGEYDLVWTRPKKAADAPA